MPHSAGWRHAIPGLFGMQEHLWTHLHAKFLNLGQSGVPIIAMKVQWYARVWELGER